MSVHKKSKSNPLPLYQKVYAALEKRAAKGEGMECTETEIMAEFSVSRDTARKALNQLETDGLARRVKGRGTKLMPRAAAPAHSVSILVNPRFVRFSSGEKLQDRFFELMDGVFTSPHASGCRVQLALQQNETPLAERVAHLAAMGPRHGVLVFSPTHLEDLIAELAKEQIPHMVYAPTGYDMNRVSDRRHQSFFRALHLILSRGKKRLLFVSREPQNLWHQDLLRAWEEAHRKVGLVPDANQVLAWKDGDPAPPALLGHSGTAYDGLVTTDSASMVHLRELLDHRGVKLSVYLSFEDHPRFSTMDPPVSAVRLPVLKIGETLMASLYQMIQFGYRGDTRVDLDCELVLRNEI